jgi:hypothetical protein
MVVGTAAVEIVNAIPVSFMLTVGAISLRIGRRIWH